MVELTEQQIREKEFESVIQEVAYYVAVDGLPRKKVYEKAEELNQLRKNPDMYVDNGEYIEYLDSDLNEPVIQKEKQINAIA